MKKTTYFAIAGLLLVAFLAGCHGHGRNHIARHDVPANENRAVTRAVRDRDGIVDGTRHHTTHDGVREHTPRHHHRGVARPDTETRRDGIVTDTDGIIRNEIPRNHVDTNHWHRGHDGTGAVKYNPDRTLTPQAPIMQRELMR